MITEDQSEVAAFLGDRRNHGGGAGEVERIDTHGAMVFLTKDVVYKLKRAVKFPYMDFSTADKRRGACQAEIEVNRRTAPAIYKGVAPIVRKAGGGLAIGRLGETPSDAIDWLVVMDRFDQSGLFDRLAARGALDDGLMTELAGAIAAFHAKARRRFDHGGARAQAKRLGVPFLGEIPIDPAIREGGDCGRPVADALQARHDKPTSDEANDGQAGAFRDLAGRVREALSLDAGIASEPADGGVLGRFRRIFD